MRRLSCIPLSERNCTAPFLTDGICNLGFVAFIAANVSLRKRIVSLNRRQYGLLSAMIFINSEPIYFVITEGT